MTQKSLEESGRDFAIRAHSAQVRKYTNEPYWKHLEEVAILSGFPEHSAHYDIAWLHDVLEDTEITYEQLVYEQGEYVAKGVLILSDLNKEGNRAHRKNLYKAQLSGAMPYIQTIKCADLISNISTIVQYDSNFAKVYLKEKRELLEVLIYAEPSILLMAHKMLDLAEFKL